MRSLRRSNPHLSEVERAELESLVQRARDSGDDWGTIDAVEEYLGDPDDDRSPREYLAAVRKDVDWHYGHVGETDEERRSADRAQYEITETMGRLPSRPTPQLNPSQQQRLIRRLMQGGRT